MAFCLLPYNPLPSITDQLLKNINFSYQKFFVFPVGQKFALMEQKVVLATVLRKFEIKSLQKIDEMRFVGELVLRSVDGVHVTFKKRQ